MDIRFALRFFDAEAELKGKDEGDSANVIDGGKHLNGVRHYIVMSFAHLTNSSRSLKPPQVHHSAALKCKH